jgi:fructosamine-3-kinase
MLTEPVVPVLICGDLWSGNMAFSKKDGNPVLFDPACYYAHHEMELSIMDMFGGFSRRHFFDVYHQEMLPEPGWQQRRALYQLYHVLNHLNLFGEGYIDWALMLMEELA